MLALEGGEVLVCGAAVPACHFEGGVAEQRLHVKR